jgi:Ni/Co efflux regulator RcnB
MKKLLSLMCVAVFAMVAASPALAENKTASTRSSKSNAVASRATSQSKNETKRAPKHHTGGKADHSENKEEKKA